MWCNPWFWGWVALRGLGGCLLCPIYRLGRWRGTTVSPGLIRPWEASPQTFALLLAAGCEQTLSFPPPCGSGARSSSRISCGPGRIREQCAGLGWRPLGAGFPPRVSPLSYHRYCASPSQSHSHSHTIPILILFPSLSPSPSPSHPNPLNWGKSSSALCFFYPFGKKAPWGSSGASSS